jgi:hypothetical protein
MTGRFDAAPNRHRCQGVDRRAGGARSLSAQRRHADAAFAEAARRAVAVSSRLRRRRAVLSSFTPELSPMHACPVDCHWCTERRCAAEGCMLCSDAGERVLWPCEHCGGLIVVSARIHVCVDCLAALRDEAARAEA